MSHWQKVKTHNKEGQKKSEIETHFGIKSKEFEKKFSVEKSKKKSKKKSN